MVTVVTLQAWGERRGLCDGALVTGAEESQGPLWTRLSGGSASRSGEGQAGKVPCPREVTAPGPSKKAEAVLALVGLGRLSDGAGHSCQPRARQRHVPDPEWPEAWAGSPPLVDIHRAE